MKIKDKMAENRIPGDFISSNKGIIAISVNSSDGFETVVVDQNKEETIFLKKIKDIEEEMPENAKLFAITSAQWDKMLNSNLFLSKRNQEE